MTKRQTLVLAAVILLGVTLSAQGEDYIRLKNGNIITCAVLRQDTATITTTSWDLRSLFQPPLQVYTRDEVESVWFSKPRQMREQHVPYEPLPSRIEVGGSASFQMWSGSGLSRRSLMVFSAIGGYSIIREVGLELDMDLTIPFEGKSDSLWKDYDVGYQISMNVVAHPVQWKGLTPFILAGGGTARDVPLGDVVLTTNNQDWNLLHFGLGIKWGQSGLGYRVEWRYGIYSFTPDAEENGVRASAQDRNANSVRASLFLYF